MIIQQNKTALTPRNFAKFAQTGGVAPITWSVLSGGAGGTISAGGTYTAPNTIGPTPKQFIDTIQAEDANGDKVTATIMVLTHIGLLANIIQTELGLQADQITLYQQKFNLPKDSRLYVSVGELTSKCIGSTRDYDTEDPDMREVLTSSWRSIAYIEIQSASLEAFLRRHEVVNALNSTYSQNMQVAESFKISKIPTNFVSLGVVEGPGIPYRFNISIPIFFATRQVKSVPYFDNFLSNEIIVDD